MLYIFVLSKIYFQMIVKAKATMILQLRNNLKKCWETLSTNEIPIEIARLRSNDRSAQERIMKFVAREIRFLLKRISRNRFTFFPFPRVVPKKVRKNRLKTGYLESCGNILDENANRERVLTRVRLITRAINLSWRVRNSLDIRWITIGEIDDDDDEISNRIRSATY